jgi:hypothetical protein
MRSIEELRAEEARIRAILADGAEAELRAIPGVVHVSVGLKQINGNATDDFSIRVYVDKKRDLGVVPENERIPKRIQGVPTDVNQVEVRTPCVNSAKFRPVTGGVQISDNTARAGTLGCLATDKADGKPILLTCHHVIGGTSGDPVFQPDPIITDLIGTVKRGFVDDFVDAAIADIPTTITTTGDEIQGLFLHASNHVAGVAEPVGGMPVFKMGRTTGLTIGRVIDPDVPSDQNYPPPLGLKTIKNGMLVQSTRVSGCCCCKCTVLDKSTPFATSGDSGSALLSEGRFAVGLVVSQGANDVFCCRMSRVETQLNISINRTIVVAPHVLPAEPHVLAGPPGPDDETVWSMMQRRLEESPFGREIGVHIRHHLPEAIDLVNSRRPVMVTWQRVQGPSFLAQWMDGVRNPSQRVRKEINGITMNAALLRLAAILKEHGSTELQQSIDAYAVDLMALLDRSATVDELIENIDNPIVV